MKLVDLTHTFSIHAPGWVGYPSPKLSYFQRHATNGIVSQYLETPLHAGTHFDGQMHFTATLLYGRSSSGATPTLQEVHDLPLGISEPSSRTPSTADLNVSPRSRSTSKARSAKHTAVSISR